MVCSRSPWLISSLPVLFSVRFAFPAASVSLASADDPFPLALPLGSLPGFFLRTRRYFLTSLSFVRASFALRSHPFAPSSFPLYGTSTRLLPRFCTFFSSGSPLSVPSFRAFRFVSSARASLAGSFSLSTYQPPCLSSHALISDPAFLLPDFGSFRLRSAMHLTGLSPGLAAFPSLGFQLRLSVSFLPLSDDLRFPFDLPLRIAPPASSSVLTARLRFLSSASPCLTLCFHLAQPVSLLSHLPGLSASFSSASCSFQPLVLHLS